MAPGREIGSALSGDLASDLVSQGSSLLAREATRLPSLPFGSNGIPGVPSVSNRESSSALPQSLPGSNPERLRRQAHEMLETLLEVFSPKGAPPEDHVPLLRCIAPVAPGEDAFVSFRVANDETTPSNVSLYCTNFVADSGYDIPSTRVSISPRSTTIRPKSEATFEIKIAVPRQTPAGLYSGLIQVSGAQYVKAVVSVQVT